MGYVQTIPIQSMNDNVVEVVRCKDCKYGQKETKKEGQMYCHLRTRESEGIYLFVCTNDWFCADGVKRDG